MATVVKQELEAEMRPELLNRIDEIVVFSPLSSADLDMITELIVSKITGRAMAEKNVEALVDKTVKDRIAKEGKQNATRFGARPIRRAAQRYVEDTLSEALVQGFLGDGDRVTLTAQRNSGGPDMVTLTRSRDNQSLVVRVEASDGGIGTTPVVSTRIEDDAITPVSSPQR